MALTRDIERLARSFLGQHLDREYVVHYLMETYQLDLAAAEAVVARVGGGRGPSAPGAGQRPQPGSEAPGRLRRQGFF